MSCQVQIYQNLPWWGLSAMLVCALCHGSASNTLNMATYCCEIIVLNDISEGEGDWNLQQKGTADAANSLESAFFEMRNLLISVVLNECRNLLEAAVIHISRWFPLYSWCEWKNLCQMGCVMYRAIRGWNIKIDRKEGLVRGEFALKVSPSAVTNVAYVERLLFTGFYNLYS